MRKVFVVVLIIMALISGSAFAKFDQKLISNAKQALALMSYGEYKKALKKLDFASNAPTAAELGDFVADEMPGILTSDVQSEVAVAYSDGSNWYVAIPVEEPSYDSVTTFVLRSKNGSRFNGYSAKLWYEVLDDVDASQSVTWQDEYSQGDIYLVADE